VPEHPLAVIEEFIERVNDAAGVHGVALVGLMVFSRYALDNAPANRTPESSIFLGRGDPNDPEGFAYQRWKYDGLEDRLAPDGPVSRILGQQWVVLVASLWNDHYRGRLAEAKGIPKNDVRDPFLADINRMRNDIVHHRGIATAQNTGRCEALRWFSPGEEMHVYAAHIVEFMSYLGTVKRSADIGDGDWNVVDGL
jgi:hypothetical protein